MAEELKNPCLSCPLLGEDKNNDTCRRCDDRCAYVSALGEMTHSVPLELTGIVGGQAMQPCNTCKKDLPEDAFDLHRHTGEPKKTCRVCEEKYFKNRGAKKSRGAVSGKKGQGPSQKQETASTDTERAPEELRCECCGADLLYGKDLPVVFRQGRIGVICGNCSLFVPILWDPARGVVSACNCIDIGIGGYETH